MEEIIYRTSYIQHNIHSSPVKIQGIKNSMQSSSDVIPFISFIINITQQYSLNKSV